VSGFLITSMSLSRWGEPSRLDMRAFYTFRFARIMPSLLLVLAIIVALGLLQVPYFENRHAGEALPPSYFVIAVGSILTFWHNVLMQSAGWFNYCLNIYWSLSVEEVFYLALPFVFLALRRKWLVIAVCLVLIGVGPYYRSLHIDEELFFECGYFACFDAIAMGCITAMLVARHKVDGGVAKALRIAGGAGIIGFYLWGIDGHEVWGFTLVALSTAVYIVGSTFAASRATAFVRWFGRHSYELYLFHIVVLALMRNIWDKKTLPAALWVPWFAVFIAAAALAGMLVSRFVSEPANKAIRARLTPMATSAG
jgi:peptidoglycan/LPS O-acetylase OafA/YrhL